MSIIDRMDRDQLLIAAFYSTPIRHRFTPFTRLSFPEDREAMSVPEECGSMSGFGDVTLGDLSDDGLRAYILKCQKHPTWKSSETVLNDDLLQSAYEEAVRNLAAKAVA